jgi:hypothetical protein
MMHGRKTAMPITASTSSDDPGAIFVTQEAFTEVLAHENRRSRLGWLARRFAPGLVWEFRHRVERS